MKIHVTKIAGFDWDDGNRHKSAEKHGVAPSEAEQVFQNEPVLVTEDTRHSSHETRFHALGRTDEGRLVHVTFTLRRDDAFVRVISARTMNRRERAHYEKEA